MTYLNQTGILLALLIILGGLPVLRTAEGENARRRLIYYLLLVGSTLLLVLAGAILITPQQDNCWRSQNGFQTGLKRVISGHF